MGQIIEFITAEVLTSVEINKKEDVIFLLKLEEFILPNNSFLQKYFLIIPKRNTAIIPVVQKAVRQFLPSNRLIRDGAEHNFRRLQPSTAKLVRVR